MEYGTFLQLDGIRGDSRISPYIGWIPAYQVTSPTSRVLGSPPREAEVHVVLPGGAFAPLLVRAHANGSVIRKAEIAFTRKGTRYQTLKMTDAYITEVRFGIVMADHPPAMEMSLVPKELKILFS